MTKSARVGIKDLSKLNSQFGVRLKQALEHADMSQADLSRVTGIDPTQIAHFISGRRLPSYSNIVAIASALFEYVSSEWLLLQRTLS